MISGDVDNFSKTTSQTIVFLSKTRLDHVALRPPPLRLLPIKLMQSLNNSVPCHRFVIYI